MSCRAVVVVKGDREGAEKWLESYNISLPVYLDSNSVLYKCLGLSRTVLILNLKTAYSFATKIVQNAFIPAYYPGDDLLQLAGDFIATNSCELVYSYAGKNQSDRPSMSELQQTLSKICPS